MLVVLAKLVHVPPASILDSQPITVPTSPPKVILPLLPLAHTVALPVKLPPITGGSTVIVTVFEVSLPQLPFVTITLN